LPWDARCIDFHQCVRTVSTASNWQVRQKMSNTSVLRWRNYEKFVGPLMKLMDLVQAGDNEKDAALTMQLLGNILRRAEISLRIDQPDPESGLPAPGRFHARRAAEQALAAG
jgi:hypothetical protein